jgi:hypothetical protein
MEDSALSRIWGVLVAPAKTFASIAARPTWALPFLLLLVLSLFSIFLLTPRIDMASMVQQGMEQSGRTVPQEQMEKSIEIMSKFKWAFAFFGLVFQAVGWVVVALVFWAALRLAGGELDFKGSFAVTMHSAMPFAVSALLTLPVGLSQTTIDYNSVKTGSLLMSNLGAFAPQDAHPGLLALLSAVDVFTLWMLVLLIIGYRIVAKVSRAKAMGVVASTWVVWVLCKVGFASLGKIMGAR